MKDLKSRIAEREQREEEAKKQAEDTGAAADTSEEEEEEEEEAGAYADYTVADLKNELDGRKIEYAANAKKAELLELLEADDAE